MTKLAASEARKRMASAISAGCPSRPSGMAAATRAVSSGVRAASTRSVAVVPGATALTVIPALEIRGFIFGLNQFNRHFVSPQEDYETDLESIWRNLRTVPIYDKDPFSVNQIGHPYQGGIYYGLARSAGLDYWQGLLYTIGGSLLWETVGETTPPSINDHISTSIGGSFVGEAMFRMASLLLEGGGETPGFWRELGAALISPPTGFNRLVFGERFKAIFPSRDPEIFIRLRLGATLTTDVTAQGLPDIAKR